MFQSRSVLRACSARCVKRPVAGVGMWCATESQGSVKHAKTDSFSPCAGKVTDKTKSPQTNMHCLPPDPRDEICTSYTYNVLLDVTGPQASIRSPFFFALFKVPALLPLSPLFRGAYFFLYLLASLFLSVVGIDQLEEGRIRDQKVASSDPGRSCGRIFFSGVNFLF